MANKGARREEKAYQTPYGEVVVARHVYQSAGGGKTYCPMERNTRIVVTSTYLGATPEYGKKRFLARLEREITQTKKRYPNATYVGIADGAESNIILIIISKKKKGLVTDVPTLQANY
jgi:hypothetical protein